jgi:hypothetical protein
MDPCRRDTGTDIPPELPPSRACGFKSHPDRPITFMPTTSFVNSLDFSYGEGECAPQVHLRWTPGAPRLVAVPCPGGYISANRAVGLPDFDLAKLRRIARLGKELNLWDDQAHLWGEASCFMVDGPFWSLELAIGRRRYRASGSTYGARFEVIRRLLGLIPTPVRDYWS